MDGTEVGEVEQKKCPPTQSPNVVEALGEVAVDEVADEAEVDDPGVAGVADDLMNETVTGQETFLTSPRVLRMTTVGAMKLQCQIYETR